LIGKIVVAHAYLVGSFEKGGWEDNQTSAFWGFLMSVGSLSTHFISFHPPSPTSSLIRWRAHTLFM
jgi:hypothetical protein